MENTVFIDKKNISRDLEAVVVEKVHKSFANYKDFVNRINISLVDVNGQKGGIDKQCKIVLRCSKSGTIFLSKKSSSASKAFHEALRAVKQLYRSKIKR